MDNRYDLNNLIQFARENAVSFTVSYWESSDELEVQIHSAAKAEEFYIKRVVSIDHFIERWKEHVANPSTRSKKPE
jgi:hypothetical protein